MTKTEKLENPEVPLLQQLVRICMLIEKDPSIHALAGKTSVEWRW